MSQSTDDEAFMAQFEAKEAEIDSKQTEALAKKKKVDEEREQEEQRKKEQEAEAEKLRKEEQEKKEQRERAEAERAEAERAEAEKLRKEEQEKKEQQEKLAVERAEAERAEAEKAEAERTSEQVEQAEDDMDWNPPAPDDLAEDTFGQHDSPPADPMDYSPETGATRNSPQSSELSDVDETILNTPTVQQSAQVPATQNRPTPQQSMPALGSLNQPSLQPTSRFKDPTSKKRSPSPEKKGERQSSRLRASPEKDAAASQSATPSPFTKPPGHSVPMNGNYVDYDKARNSMRTARRNGLGGFITGPLATSLNQQQMNRINNLWNLCLGKSKTYLHSFLEFKYPTRCLDQHGIQHTDTQWEGEIEPGVGNPDQGQACIRCKNKGAPCIVMMRNAQTGVGEPVLLADGNGNFTYFR